ncbi:MAG: hypothetical protein GY932_10185 [Arcobacter sp.]|nr:hypothetical protein [Flavobacteriaceae bacterium]MCP4970949.1 hypothetical protein [Arcobacter sp.]
MKRERDLTIDCNLPIQFTGNTDFRPPKLRRTMTLKEDQFSDLIKFNQVYKVLKRTQTVKEAEFQFLLSVNKLTNSNN